MARTSRVNAIAFIPGMTTEFAAADNRPHDFTAPAVSPPTIYRRNE